MKYFAAELLLTIMFFRERKLEHGLYAPAVNGSTLGLFYTNMQHGDDDVGFTMLPVGGQPSGGGEFYHGTVGRAHVLRAGDLMWVNPLKRHSTAEFRICEGDAERGMFAFFLKAALVRALGLSADDAKQRGLSQTGSQPKRKRAQRGKAARAARARVMQASASAEDLSPYDVEDAELDE